MEGTSKIMAVNTWAVAVLRYAAGVLKWTAKELKELDKQTRKVMTIYVVFTLRVILTGFICQEEKVDEV